MKIQLRNKHFKFLIKYCICFLKKIFASFKWSFHVLFWSRDIQDFSRPVIFSAHLSSKKQSWVIQRLNYICGSCSMFPSSTSLIGNERGARLISADPYLLPIGPMPHNTNCTRRDDEFLISRTFVLVDLRLVNTTNVIT